MILIDLGNSCTKIYDEKNELKLSNEQLFNYLDTTKEGVLLCSVVPKMTNEISQKYKNVINIDYSFYNEMFNNQDQKLNSKGADRIITAYAAKEMIQEKVIVVDVGTCVTIDIVFGRDYLGGFIYPGFSMIENILYKNIDQLPLAKNNNDTISTESQIYNANITGFVGAIDKMIGTVYTQDYQVVFTGGTINKLMEENNVDLIDQLAHYNPKYVPTLMKDGLLLFERNILNKL